MANSDDEEFNTSEKFNTPEKAFAEAERRIANAKKSGAKVLIIQLHSLRTLPPSVADLTSLEGLNLDNCRVDDLAPLASLSGLRSLWLNRTRVTNLAPLAGLSGLKSLCLNRSKVTKLLPLARLTALRRLEIDNTGIADLSLLAGLTDIEILRLNNNNITDLTPLTGMKGLRNLKLNQSGVTDLTPLAGLVALESLWLERTEVTDLTPLAKLTALRHLGLSRTEVTDVKPLASLTSLQWLRLNGTEVTDLTPLHSLQNLCDLPRQRSFLFGLSANDTPVSKLAPFDRLLALEQPACTIETINYLRRQQGVDGFEIKGYQPPLGFVPPDHRDFRAPDQRDEATIQTAPPLVPTQGEAVKFAPNAAGQVEIAFGAGLPDAERGALSSKQREMLDAAARLEGFAKNSNGFQHLVPDVQVYRTALNKPVTELREGDIDILFARGIYFQQAYNDLLSEIKEGVAPTADRRLNGPLEVLLSLHGPFIQGTTHGTQIYDAMDRDRRKRAEELEVKEREAALQRDMAQEAPRSLTEASAEIAKTAADIMAREPQPERASTTGRTIINNKWKALSDSVAKWIKSQILKPELSLKGAVTTTILAQGVAATPAGVAAVGAVKVTATAAMAGLSAAASAAGPIPAEIASFMFNHADQIRHLAAAGGPTFDWLRVFVSWLEKIYPHVKGKV
jgi:hypothetical protein